jgi:hypothetical protein
MGEYIMSLYKTRKMNNFYNDLEAKLLNHDKYPQPTKVSSRYNMCDIHSFEIDYYASPPYSKRYVVELRLHQIHELPADATKEMKDIVRTQTAKALTHQLYGDIVTEMLEFRDEHLTRISHDLEALNAYDKMLEKIMY